MFEKFWLLLTYNYLKLCINLGVFDLLQKLFASYPKLKNILNFK